MKIRIEGIEEADVSTSSFFTGSSSQKGYFVRITFLEDSCGLFYIGNLWEGVAKKGEQAYFNMLVSSPQEAVYKLQDVLDIVNYCRVPDPTEKYQVVVEKGGIFVPVEGEVFEDRDMAVDRSNVLEENSMPHRVRNVLFFEKLEEV